MWSCRASAVLGRSCDSDAEMARFWYAAQNAWRATLGFLLGQVLEFEVVLSSSRCSVWPPYRNGDGYACLVY